MGVDDLTNQRFGKLVVISRVENASNGKAKWLCRCDCGNNTTVCGVNLKNGHTKSCGCLSKKHGHARKERLYNIWVGMRQRCRDKNADNWKHYGGRGISVCEEWNEYPVFRTWALSNGYDEAKSIDRIDVNGNYCPENCRWADSTQQNNNVRSNRLFTYNGETLTMAQWARKANMPYKLLKQRIRQGMELERALTQPKEVHVHG